MCTGQGVGHVHCGHQRNTLYAVCGLGTHACLYADSFIICVSQLVVKRLSVLMTFYREIMGSHRSLSAK